MRISKIKISGILGIDNLEFEAGQFNEIAGTNGTGKTSVIEAIKSVIKGGEDATLLRQGCDKGEIVLVLDDATEIRERITPKTATRSIERNGVKLAKPSEEIRALTDMISVNPVEFLRAPPKKRVNVLLESLPMKVDPVRLAEIVGHAVAVSPEMHALETISSIHQSIFDDRTGTNRAVREKEATINQLAATLPEGAIGTANPTDKSGLLATLNEIDGRKDAEITRIENKLLAFRGERDQRVEAARAVCDAAIAQIQEQIDALRRQMDDARVERDKLVLSANTDFDAIAGKAAAQRELTLNNHREERRGTETAIAQIDADAAQAARHATTRETVERMRVEADNLREDAEKQTAALQALESYKSELLAALPVDGLSVKDGEIFRHGIPFDRLNTAQQVEIAIEIAKLRAGPLAVICVDGIESLDNDHYEQFREQILQTDLQLFVARVSNGDFEVTAEG